jgi:hypothetical protein
MPRAGIAFQGRFFVIFLINFLALLPRRDRSHPCFDPRCQPRCGPGPHRCRAASLGRLVRRQRCAQSGPDGPRRGTRRTRRHPPHAVADGRCARLQQRGRAEGADGGARGDARAGRDGAAGALRQRGRGRTTLRRGVPPHRAPGPAVRGSPRLARHVRERDAEVDSCGRRGRRSASSVRTRRPGHHPASPAYTFCTSSLASIAARNVSTSSSCSASRPAGSIGFFAR